MHIKYMYILSILHSCYRLLFKSLNWRSSKTLSVVNGKSRYVHIYIYKYRRHQNVAQVQNYVK